MNQPMTVKPVLTVYTLGTFSVYMGNRRIFGPSQRSSRVWKLFCYLISNRHKPISTEQLIDMLWQGHTVENPIKALYSLVYRLRTLLNQYNEEKIEYICFQHNSYQWNASAPCFFDTDAFESYIQKAQDHTLSLGQQIDLYTQALHLYQGEYLSGFSREGWIAPMAYSYKRKYIQAVLQVCQLHALEEDYHSIVRLCQNAIAMDPLEETAHEFLIDALFHLGQATQALQHYDAMSNILYREMGVRPSAYLQALHKRIRQETADAQHTITLIQQNLTEEPGSWEGAFFCELNVFRKIYQLECRSVERSGKSALLCVINICAPQEEMYGHAALSAASNTLKQIVLAGLHHSDVVSQYSSRQLILLLSCLTMEDCEALLCRLENAFYQTYSGVPIHLTHDIEILNTQKHL